MYYELTDHFQVAAGPERVWDFFSTARNLPRITPPSLGFTLLTPGPVRIEQDSILEYQIRWMGLPIRWKTRIIDWSPPRQFIDLQVRGPYALWHHQHTFTPADDGSTICFDRVVYRLPLWVLGRLIHPILVRGQLQEIFRYRRSVIGRELGWVGAQQDDVLIRSL